MDVHLVNKIGNYHYLYGKLSHLALLNPNKQLLMLEMLSITCFLLSLYDCNADLHMTANMYSLITYIKNLDTFSKESFPEPLTSHC